MDSTQESQEGNENDSLLSERQQTSVYSTQDENQNVRYTKRQWIIFGVLAATMFFSSMIFSLQGPFFPKEAEKKGISPSVYGLVFGVFELVVFIMCPLYGHYLRLTGPNLMLKAGSLMMALSCIVFGFLDFSPPGVPFISLAFAVRIVEALGQAAFDTAAFAIIAFEFPDNIATTFSVLETLAGIGVLVGPSVGGVLYEAGGYIYPFAGVGGFLLLAAIITACLLPKIEDSAAPKSSFLRLLRIPTVLICYYSVVSAAFCINFLQPVLEPYLRQFNLSTYIVSLVFVINGGVYALTAVVWGFLADRYVNPKLICCLGSIFTIASFLLMGPADFIPLKPALWLVIVALVLNGIGIGAVFVAAFLECNRTVLQHGFPNNTETYGMISGMWASGLALGGLLGPSVSGILYDTVGFKNACLANVGIHALVGIANLIYLIFERKEARNEYEQLSE